MGIAARILFSILVLAVFVIGSTALVAAKTISAEIGLVLRVVGIVAAIFISVKAGKKADK